jgi:hypothetical protein
MKRRKDADRDLDAAWVVALVASEIDDSTREQREILLADLIYAAWPSATAQNQ